MATNRVDIPSFLKPNRGSYTANLIGTIRSHLEGLQGYDVMALELIQNADDAGSNGQGAPATEIIFDVTETGLCVRNDGLFTYCRALHEYPCPLQVADGYGCDFHRITEVASGGKLSRSDNIGRFGIGFVSTYQIADHPQIHSAGIKLTLIPERQEWLIDDTEQDSGTTFFLPWANDPKSEARVRLGASAVTRKHIEELVEDFRDVLRRALLFLRHLKRAELRRNGTLVLSVDLERNSDDETELLVTFMPTGEMERWLILRADAAYAAYQVYDRYLGLEKLDRKTLVSVAIRLDSEPLQDGQGLLYAYLPTEQATGLPVHVNADFFPEADRKALIFSGSQHQQAWNELLIATAADALARDLEGLRDKLGAAHLWSMLNQAYAITQDKVGRYPRAFHSFWYVFKVAVERGAAVALTHDGAFLPPPQVLYLREPLTPILLNVLQALGGNAIAQSLRPYRNVLHELGAQELTFTRLVGFMADSFGEVPELVESETPERFASFYLPLWKFVESLFPEGTTTHTQQTIGRLKTIPFIVDPDLHPYTIDGSYRGTDLIQSQQLAPFFPNLWFTNDELARFSHLNNLVNPFQLKHAVENLYYRLVIADEPIQDELPTNHNELGQLYSILALLDDVSQSDSSVYVQLRKLPIWMTGKGFVSADHALLPGDFTDPTGQAELINQKLLDAKALSFVQDKLGVKRQTIDEFVRSVVPRFIGSNGPEDLTLYRTLIITLATHPGLLDDNELCTNLAKLRIVPTQDGTWAMPADTYFQTKELKEILGDATSRWVHVSRIPDNRAARFFFEALGVRRTPSPVHLAERIIEIAESGPPTEGARKQSEKVFYALCDLYGESDKGDDVETAVSLIAERDCLPGDDEIEQWFRPAELYAPFRYQAFKSQAYSLDFRNTQRLNPDLLEALGISSNPETELVVNHLFYCVEHREKPHSDVWRILNERAKKGDTELEKLKEKPCIYLDALGEFLSPNRFFFQPQHLGRYAYTIPATLEEYRALFKIIGVKDNPEPKDYVDIVLSIVETHYMSQETLEAEDLKIYEACMLELADAWGKGTVSESDLERLQTAPTLLNLLGQFCHPDEVVLHNSEWHRHFFGKDVDHTLCKPPAHEMNPFFQKLGARQLSDIVVVKLDYVEGVSEPEDEVCEILTERVEIIARMLHDKPMAIRKRLEDAIQRVTALSHDRVKIQVSLNLDHEPIMVEAIDVKAFYEASRGALILARPFTERSWVHLLNTLLHQFMQEESASHITTLALALRPLMNMTLAEAVEQLADAHVPFFEVETEEYVDVTSKAMDDSVFESVLDLPADTEQPGEEETNPKVSDARVHGKCTSVEKGNVAHETEEILDKSIVSPPDGTVHRTLSGPNSTFTGTDYSPPLDSFTTRPHSGGNAPMGATTEAKPSTKRRQRPDHKSLWDRKLISYVRQRRSESEQDVKDRSGEDDAKYKLAIEAAARDLVCAYERKHGRIPEEMANNNPGYDILSFSATTDQVERYIEVKGTTGEWNLRGVGLSSSQFAMSQKLGDQYWLYVVEFALDQEGARVHAIQSPARKVDQFMFDGEWRYVATYEVVDPTIGFVAGALIDCGLLGAGQIVEVQNRGQIRHLVVNFDDGRLSHLPLNLKTMRIIEDNDGEDDT